ncbi:MAG: response regulator [Desulfobacteraceae bacterium]|jgi:two-component system response regulator|nr:response regulator [Desulfobacteraceae bacterium]
MGNKTILLVEDNPDDVELTLRAFKKNDISNKVIVVTDGAEALDFLYAKGKYAERDEKDLPILVLLDLKLPKIDGMEVLQSIRQNEFTKLLPVVILTSSAEEQDMIDGYNLGVNSYVRKPVNFNDFQQAIKVLGLYWLVWNEPPPLGKKG